MIFHHKVGPGYQITALCEDELELSGNRDEGGRIPITLKSNISHLRFEYVPKNIHPDLAALICFCTFYPFLKNKVTFPQPISLHAKSLFERFSLTSMKQSESLRYRSVKVCNASASISPFKPSGNDSLISFGGGMDSVALSILLPDCSVLNQFSRFHEQLAMEKLFDKLDKSGVYGNKETDFINSRVESFY